MHRHLSQTSLQTACCCREWVVCQMPHARPAEYGKKGGGHKALYLGEFERQSDHFVVQGSDRQPTSLFLVDAARGRQVVTAWEFAKLAGESPLLAPVHPHQH